MAAVMTSNVTVFDGISQFSARDAVIELDDDRTFTLAKIDKTTGARTEVIFDRIPVSELTVAGSSGTPTLAHNGVKKRIDFSFGGRMAMAGGVIGMVASTAIINRSGVNEWVAALRENGATVNYRSAGKTVALGVGIGGGIVVLIVIVVVVAVAVSGGFN